MRPEASARENFFIAKICDSESAPSAFGRCRRVAMMRTAWRALYARIKKTSAAQALSAILTFADVEFSRTIRAAPNLRRRVAAERALHALTLRRQHFLKRDAVFSNVLVYSGCSAYRFPNARSD
jgi:hypothetical protein